MFCTGCLLTFVSSAINHAVTRDQNIHALEIALSAFSHKNTDLHSYEVDMGAVHALTLKLGYCLAHSTDEVNIVCLCLKKVLSGCSTDRKMRVYQEMGSELCPLLLRSRQVSILRVFCKVGPAKSLMIRSIVGPLLTLLQIKHGEEGICYETLGAIKDLSFRTSGNDKESLYFTPDLPETMLRIGLTPKAREYVAAIWWNLAMSPQVAVAMGKNAPVMKHIKSCMLDESSSKIRRNAISAAGNLVTQTENVETFVNDETMCGALRQVALQDSDPDCRRRAMRTIRCIMSVHPRPDMLDFFTRIATQDIDRDTRVQSIESLSHLRFEEKLAEPLTRSLIQIVEKSLDSKMTLLACTLLPNGSAEMLASESTEDFWKSVGSAFDEDKQSWTQVSDLIRIVSNSQHKSKLVSEPVVKILASLLTETKETEADDSVAIEVLSTLEDLIKDNENRRLLAESDDLLSSLVSFALVANTAKQKDRAKCLLLSIVPEL